MLFLSTLVTALYLTWYSDPTTTMAIHWHTSHEDLEDRLYLLRSPDEWEEWNGTHGTIESAKLTVHSLELTHLSPHTLYSFRIGDDPTVHTFQTAPATLETPISFVIGGDAFAVPDLFRSMNQAIRSHDPLFAVVGGDLAYAIHARLMRTETLSTLRWHAFLQSWMETLTTESGRSIPILFAPGNHDISPEHQAGLYQMFPGSSYTLYRAVDFGSYLTLLLLDTGHLHPIPGPQTEWLASTLASHATVPYLIPIYHVGAYPSLHPKSNRSLQVRTYWCPQFETFHIPYAFEHHSHTFKRTVPLKGGVPDPTGVTYLGDGCWGARPRTPSHYPYMAETRPEVHVYLLTLSSESSYIQPIAIDNQPIGPALPLLPRQ